MAFSEQSVISKIEILEDGQIQIRRSDRVLKDGVVIAETYHREVLPAGAALEEKSALISPAASAAMTKFAEDKADKEPK